MGILSVQKGNIIMNFRGKINDFFRERYGYDELSKFMLVLYIILIILYLLTGFYWLNIVAFIDAIILLFRILSKNIEKRRAENRKFMDITAPIRTWFENIRNSSKSSSKVFICPNCHQKVRVPKGRGKIEITCPKCNHKFIKRS